MCIIVSNKLPVYVYVIAHTLIKLNDTQNTRDRNALLWNAAKLNSLRNQ